MLAQALEQMAGLLQAALAHPQVGQADHGRLPAARHAMVEVVDGSEQFGLGLLPAPGRGQDAAVVGTAERRHHVAVAQALCRRPYPLVGPGHVVDRLARPEQPAEDLVDRGQLGQLAGAEGRQRLVGERQPLFDAVDHDVGASEIGQGQELDVGVAEAAPDGDCLPELCLADLGVRFGEGLDDQHPAVLGPIHPRLLQQGPGAGQPAAAHGQSPSTFPVIQATVRAARPAAMLWRSRR